MIAKPLDLAKARVLISNDDGIQSPGIKLLARAMRRVAGEVWVAAPEYEQSAASHSLTTRRPLRIRRSGPRTYAVDGTPTDAVLLAVKKIMKDCPPDIMLSGVNRGGNLGEDVTYSGTVAAAIEATLLGVPAIAFSQETGASRKAKWRTAEHYVVDVVRRLVAIRWPRSVLMNVNFPDVTAREVTGIEATRGGRRKVGTMLTEGTDPRGDRYYWMAGWRESGEFEPGTDLEAVQRGAISVTPLCIDLSHRPTLGALRTVLD